MFNSIRHLNALRAFEAAARHKSIASAAQELHVSHSVVSQHVRNLEEWFGLKLFERLGNRIELTEHARQLEPQIAHGYQILNDACENMLRLTHKGTINISAEPAIASRWLRKKLTAFSKKFPNIECNLRSEWRAPSIDDEHVDIIVHFEERFEHANIRYTNLFTVEGFPACAPEVFDQLAGGYSENGFSDFPLIHDNGRHIWQHWYAEHERGDESWKVGSVHSDLALAIDAAVDGEGIFLADKIICARELANGTLKVLDERTSRCTRYCVAVDEQSHGKSIVETFKIWIVDQAKRETLGV